MGELLEISWTSHRENLCEGIWRLFDAEFGRDFKILFNENRNSDDHRPLRGHFLIMQIFCQTLANSNIRQFQFEDVDINSEDLRSLLEFMYRGRTQVKLKRLKEVKRAAEKLGLNSFIDIVQEKMEGRSPNFKGKNNGTDKKVYSEEEKKLENEISESGMVILNYGSVSDLPEEQVGDLMFKLDQTSDKDILKTVESRNNYSCFILKKLLESNTNVCDYSNHTLKDKPLNFEMEKNYENEELNSEEERNNSEEEMNETGIVILNYGSISEFPLKKDEKLWSKRDQILDDNLENIVIDGSSSDSNVSVCDKSSEEHGSKRGCGSLDNFKKCTVNFEPNKNKRKLNLRRKLNKKDNSFDLNSSSSKTQRNLDQQVEGVDSNGATSGLPEVLNFSHGVERDDLNMTHISPGSILICVKCGRRFKNKVIFDQHVLNHSDPDVLPDQCPYCPFKTKYLRSHLVSKHQRDLEGNFLEKSYKCDECDFKCVAAFLLWNHKTWKHGEKSYKCKQCPYTSRTKGNLDKHVNAMHSDGLHFRSRTKFASHSKDLSCETFIEGRKNDDLNITNGKPEDPSDGSRDAISHYGTTSGLSEEPHKFIRRKFICTECGKRFRSRGIFNQHVLTHSDPNGLPKCPYCPFKTKYLRVHLASKHQRDLEGNFLEKSLKCDQCNFVCAAQFLLYNHKVWSHGEKIHKCDQCPYTSRIKRSLDNHVLTVHTTEKNFMCETCGSFFNSKIKLYKHKMTHSSPRFTCEICGKIKIGKGNMKRHLNQHKTFECPICKYGFKVRYKLKRHLSNTHKLPDDEVIRLIAMVDNDESSDNVKEK